MNFSIDLVGSSYYTTVLIVIKGGAA